MQAIWHFQEQPWWGGYSPDAIYAIGDNRYEMVWESYSEALRKKIVNLRQEGYLVYEAYQHLADGFMLVIDVLPAKLPTQFQQ